MKKLFFLIFAPFLGFSQEIIDVSKVNVFSYVETVEPTCSDGIQNGDETGVDCGGSCLPCSSVCEPSETPLNGNSISVFTDSGNAGQTVEVNNVIDATGQTFAPGLVIKSGSGLITGTSINVNDACIYNDFTQIFASTARINDNGGLYDNTPLSPETFGAVGNGVTNDNAAIDALIINSNYGLGNPAAVYVKNNPSTYTRSGTIDIDWNGSHVIVTSISNFPMETLTTGYVMTFDNINVVFRNGDFSGGSMYGRLFRFNGQNKVHFINNEVHDFYAPVTIRCVAFYMDFDSFDTAGGGVEDILFDGNTVYNIIAEGDGNFNNSPAGIAKGWWYSITGMSDTSTFTIIHRNNIVYNVIGDDAEAWYARGGTQAVNPNGTWLIENEYYYNNTRRNIKANIANLTIQNNLFEEIDNSLFQSAQQMGSNVDIFQDPGIVQNIVVHNNVFRARPGQDYHYHMLSITEAKGVTITDNEFRMNQVENYAGLRLGSGTSTYSGYLEDITVSGNDFYNCGVQMLPYYAPVGQIDIGNGTMTYDPSSNDWGAQQAAIRTTNNGGTVGNIDFHDYVVNISGSSASLFNGLVYSQGADVTNFNITDVQLNYSGISLTNSVGWLVGDFGSSNSITNLEITGDETPTLNIDGSGSPVTSGVVPSLIFN